MKWKLPSDHWRAEWSGHRRDVLLHWFHALLPLIWHSEQIPSSWKKARIVPIMKKGHNQEWKTTAASASCPLLAKFLWRSYNPGYRNLVNRAVENAVIKSSPFVSWWKKGLDVHTIIIFIDFKSPMKSIGVRACPWQDHSTPENVIRCLNQLRVYTAWTIEGVSH